MNSQEIASRFAKVFKKNNDKSILEIIAFQDQETERLNNIINEIEDSIVGKINVLYQVRGQSNAIQELNILLRRLRDLKGGHKE